MVVYEGQLPSRRGRGLNGWVVQNDGKSVWKVEASDMYKEESIGESREMRSENGNKRDKSEDNGGFVSSLLRLVHLYICARPLGYMKCRSHTQFIAYLTNPMQQSLS
jgi:hypothetical protein